MTTPHSHTTLAALALLVFGCSIGSARTAYARPHSAGATAHITRAAGYPGYRYTRNDSIVYAYGSDHPFIRFDLPSLPVDARIVRARVSYYQTQGASPYPYTSLVHLLSDPLTRDTESLYYDISHGQQVSAATTNAGTGWIRKVLNEYGTQMLQERLSQDWFALGIGPWTNGGRAAGYAPDSTYTPNIEMSYVLPGDPDFALLSARLTTYPLVRYETDTIEATLTYLGDGLARPFYLHLMRNNIRADSLRVESLTQGETTRVLFAIRNQVGGLANYCCFCDDTTDILQGNDSAWVRDWVFPFGTYAAEGFNGDEFPPAGWDTLYDGGVGYWQRCIANEYLHSGSGGAVCSRDTGMRNDDWLISPAVMPLPGYADSGYFLYRGLDAAGTDSIEAWSMRRQTRDDTLSKLAQVPISSNSYQLCRFGLDQFDGDTVFIGIRAVSSSAYRFSYAFVDDVYFIRQPSGGVETPRDASLPASLSVIPNPARSGEAIGIRCTTSEPGRLSVHDALGRSVWSTSIPRTQDTDTRPLVLPRLAAGVYLVRLESGPQTTTAKLVIQP